MRTVVVVGASLAGVRAAEALRHAGYDGEVVLLSGETTLPYDRPPLSKQALVAGPDAQNLLLQPAGWYADGGIDLRLGSPAARLDASRREVTLVHGEVLPYDGLILATGSVVRRLDRSADTGPVHSLRSLEDCQRLHGRLRAGGRLVVIGGGFIGLEAASSARQSGMEVCVVELSTHPLQNVLGERAGRWVAALHRRHGVQLHCGAGLERIERSAAGSTIRTRDGVVLPADVVVAGVGVTPATAWLEGSGIASQDGVLCDERLRASAPGVVAAGDIARWPNRLFAEQMRLEHWTSAAEQGAYAALSLLGLSDGPYAPVPYFWSDQHGARLRFVGRAADTDEARVVEETEDVLVVLYRREDRLVGALCVNAPRRLAELRSAIAARAPWEDVAR